MSFSRATAKTLYSMVADFGHILPTERRPEVALASKSSNTENLPRGDYNQLEQHQ